MLEAMDRFRSEAEKRFSDMCLLNEVFGFLNPHFLLRSDSIEIDMDKFEKMYAVADDVNFTELRLEQCLSTECIVHPRVYKIFQRCTTMMGCTRCVLFKNSHNVPHISSTPAQCVNFSQILKPYLSGSVHCLSFPACLFIMLVT